MPNKGISNYSKYIEVFEYFLTPIVYVRFSVCPNSNEICLFNANSVEIEYS